MDRKKRRGIPSLNALIGAALLLLVSISLGPAGTAAATEQESVFAVIDGETVSESQFQKFLVQYARNKFYHRVPEGGLDQVKAEAAEALILQRLLVQEAKRRGIAGDPEAVAATMARYEERYQGTDSWDLYREKEAELRTALLERSKVGGLEDEIRDVEDPGDVELNAFYSENLDLFTEPARSKLRVILIGVPPWENPASWQTAKQTADELAAKLAAGESFPELARQHSTHASAAEGGDLGFVHSGMLSTAAQEAVDSLALGEVSPPVRVLEGYTLFRLEDRSAPEVKDFAEVRERVLKLYQRQQSETRWQAFLEGLRSKAEVVMPAKEGPAETE